MPTSKASGSTRVGGYCALTPGWPDDPQTVEEANEHPEVFAHKTIGQVADHFAEVIGKLKKKPVVIGHSFGGLLTQIIADVAGTSPLRMCRSLAQIVEVSIRTLSV